MDENEIDDWLDEKPERSIGLMVKKYEDIEEEKILWLWENRIAVGKLNIFGGNAGLNKSTLTLAIAATVTLGANWPDKSECVQGDVIIMSSEDDAGDTIKPRLRLAGADMTRVHNLSMVSYVGEESRLIRATFSFMRHLFLLDEYLAKNPQIRLIVVDPIAAFTSGMKNPFDAGEVRGAMAPVIDLLSRHNVAMVALMHLNKAEGMSALNRFSGSGAWTQVARSVWFIDRDQEESMRRVFLPVKVNIGPDTFGNSFDVDIKENHPVVNWLPDPVEMTADEHLGLATRRKKEKKIDYACKWLKDLLSGGALRPLEVQEKAEEHGIAAKTLRDAKEVLCVESVRVIPPLIMEFKNRSHAASASF